MGWLMKNEDHVLCQIRERKNKYGIQLSHSHGIIDTFERIMFVAEEAGASVSSPS